MAPPKKPTELRRRRNKTAGAAVLTLVPRDAKARAKATSLHPLPKRGDGWHTLTQRWWKNIWASPMAAEYDESDVDELYVLAVLVDAFWRSPTKELAGEIRLQRQCFGLSPLDRRRLEWEIAKDGQTGQAGRPTPSTTSPRSRSRKDPRSALA